MVPTAQRLVIADDPSRLEPQPWERQPREGKRAFDAFAIYRDMPLLTRSLRKTEAIAGKSHQLIAEWSVRWAWVKRVDAWDAERDRHARQVQLDEIERVKLKHVRIADQMLDKVEEAIPFTDLHKRPQALADWFTAGVKAQRDALGMAEPKARQDVKVSGDPANPIQHELTGVIAALDPATVMQLRDLSLNVTLAKVQQAKGLPVARWQDMPILEAEAVDDDDPGGTSGSMDQS